MLVTLEKEKDVKTYNECMETSKKWLKTKYILLSVRVYDINMLWRPIIRMAKTLKIKD